MQREIHKAVDNSLKKLKLSGDFLVEHTGDVSKGHYTTSVAMSLAKEAGKKPKELAEEIVEHLGKVEDVERVEVAGPGFINFFLSDSYFKKNIGEILEKKDVYGLGNSLEGTTVLVEHSQANPFKVFHIGHLMNNTIGEALRRITEAQGAEALAVNYQGDVGRHVAMAIWGMGALGGEMPREGATLLDKADFLGDAYAAGNSAFETDPAAKEKILEINKKVYDHSDEEINRLYDMGRTWSLEYFEEMYKLLDTKFAHYFFESETAAPGKELVEKYLGKVFEKSDGALVFKGEEFGLHTRVFVTKEGLPTYEAKDSALFFEKKKWRAYDESIVVTGNEQNDYFKVVLMAVEKIDLNLSKKTKHFGHGMLRLPTGKMSSRTGNVVSAMEMITKVSGLIREKMKESRIVGDEKEKVIWDVAVGAIKYSILRQAIGKDIIFDFDKSLSFEGDSGPYLQYAQARAGSIIEKARELGINPEVGDEVTPVHYKLEEFPRVVSRAYLEYAPQKIATYLIELASLFNAYYANEKFVDVHEKRQSAGRVALAQATRQVLRNGLKLLGIQAPERM